ncbi:MAG TPA: SDR family NAD(P)-dependent oxidoreductase [Solirubrobacteraceae bacterium]|jgi:short-subunit dehydrogenase
MRISGSTVLLTGASGGIGQAIARALHERGAKLVLTGRRAEVLAPLAAELEARSLSVDLALPAEVDRLLAEAGEVDILIANAALPASGRLDTYTQEQVDRALNVNLRAPIVLAHALLPGMLERGRGHLLFVSSLSGKAAAPDSSLYSATKFGLRGFALSLRADLYKSGVGVSVVLPGFISDTGLRGTADVKLPRGAGMRTPVQVARAVVRAIERNRAEVEVAPPALRVGTAFASLAPEIAGRVARLMGAEEIAHEVSSAQREMR